MIFSIFFLTAVGGTPRSTLSRFQLRDGASQDGFQGMFFAIFLCFSFFLRTDSGTPRSAASVQLTQYDEYFFLTKKTPQAEEETIAIAIELLQGGGNAALKMPDVLTAPILEVDSSMYVFSFPSSLHEGSIFRPHFTGKV